MNGIATRKELDDFIAGYNLRMKWNADIKKAMDEKFIAENEEVKDLIDDPITIGIARMPMRTTKEQHLNSTMTNTEHHWAVRCIVAESAASQIGVHAKTNNMEKKKIYLASSMEPMFRGFIREAAETLRKKFDVYVPMDNFIPNAWDYPNNEWGLMVF